jgi:hypothetical protein
VPTDAGGKEDFYKSRLLDGEPVGSNRRFQVSKRRLDSLLHPESVAFIKIDVEGHELEVIRGAEGLLGKSHPALLIEVGGDPAEAGSSSQQLFERLAAHGYTPYVYRDRRLTPWKPGENWIDYAFLRPEHMKRVEPLLAPAA